MAANSAVRILVVDDDVQIRRALHRALSEKGYEIRQAASGEEALEAAALECPRLVILDLSMPGMNGLDVCGELRKWFNGAILVLSVRDRDTDKVQALDLGADDYLTKPFSTEELLARVRAHLRRCEGVNLTESIFVLDPLKIDFSRRQVMVNHQEIKLTKTEFALLTDLIKNAGRVMTYGQLLTHVWGPEYEGDLQTLRVHAGNLRRKIEADPSRPRFILTEPGVGYRFVEEQTRAKTLS